MKFTEAKLEQAFIELLGNEDFPHFLGNTISRSEDEVLIEELDDKSREKVLFNIWKSRKTTTKNFSRN